MAPLLPPATPRAAGRPLAILVATLLALPAGVAWGAPANALRVPWFELAPRDPGGITTLFAVRNEGTETVSLELRFFQERGGAPVAIRIKFVAPNAVATFNVRDVLAGVPSLPDLVRGWVEIRGRRLEGSTAAVKLSGDFFHVDPGNNSASGDVLGNPARRSEFWYTRFLNGGPFSGGTELMAMVPLPEYPSSTSIGLRLEDEYGTDVFWPHGIDLPEVPPPPSQVHLDIGDFAGETPFGSIQFWINGGGHVQMRHRAAGRYEVGLPASVNLHTPNLILPHFETTPGDPLGPNTLFAVHNAEGVRRNIIYRIYDDRGSYRTGYSYRHPPRTVETVNLGTKLAADGISIPRGYVEVYVANWNDSNPIADGSGYIHGDFFLVDSRNDYASGGVLPRTKQQDGCWTWSTRFLNGGAFQGGTRLLVHAYHAGFTATVYDESGRAVKSLVHRKPYKWVASVDLAPLIGTTPRFGSLRINLQSKGFVFVEHRAAGKFAVGLPANCMDP